MTPFVPPVCPTTCGLAPSFLIREVTCGSSLGQTVADGLCMPNTRPDATVPCPGTAACSKYILHI